MMDRTDIGPLQPGEPAPDFVLDAITRDGKIAIEDFRGKKPVLVGLFRGLHCAFCRRHIASLAQLTPALNEKGIDNLTVVNTPIDRAKLYFRYHPMPQILAASDPERASHRAFGLPNVQFTENESVWPHKISMAEAAALKGYLPDEMPRPMTIDESREFLNKKDGYEVMDADKQMLAAAQAQLVGQFLLDRHGIVRWTFTEAAEGGRHLFGGPDANELMSAASNVAA